MQLTKVQMTAVLNSDLAINEQGYFVKPYHEITLGDVTKMVRKIVQPGDQPITMLQADQDAGRYVYHGSNDSLFNIVISNATPADAPSHLRHLQVSFQAPLDEHYFQITPDEFLSKLLLGAKNGMSLENLALSDLAIRFDVGYQFLKPIFYNELGALLKMYYQRITPQEHLYHNQLMLLDMQIFSSEEFETISEKATGFKELGLKDGTPIVHFDFMEIFTLSDHLIAA